MADAREGAPIRPGAAVERWLRAQVAEAGGSGVRWAMALGALSAALAVPQAWLLAHAVAPIVMERGPLASALAWLAPVLLILVLRFVLSWVSSRRASSITCTSMSG